jgi:hypothetical protein
MSKVNGLLSRLLSLPLHCHPSRRLQEVLLLSFLPLSLLFFTPPPPPPSPSPIRSILGNASAANASDGLKFAKESAFLGAEFLKKYKSHLQASPEVGSNFQSPQITKITNQSSRLGPATPALFSGSGLLSDEAKNSIEKVKLFIKDEILPREKEIQEAGYEGNNRWKV